MIPRIFMSDDIPTTGIGSPPKRDAVAAPAKPDDFRFKNNPFPDGRVAGVAKPLPLPGSRQAKDLEKKAGMPVHQAAIGEDVESLVRGLVSHIDDSKAELASILSAVSDDMASTHKGALMATFDPVDKPVQSAVVNIVTNASVSRAEILEAVKAGMAKTEAAVMKRLARAGVV